MSDAMSTAKAKAKQQPVVIHRREPWADVDDEIRDVMARIKRLEADEADAAYKLEDTRWRAIGKALTTARNNRDKLETKRAEIMAGVYVEPVAKVVAPQQKPAQPATEAERKYFDAETAALKAMGLDEEAREMTYTYGSFAVFYKHLEGALKDMRDRIESLEEGKVIGVKYLGVWQRALPYDKGAVVTYQNDMWTCLQNVAEGIVPGSNTAAWQLSSKAGKPVTVSKPRAGK